MKGYCHLMLTEANGPFISVLKAGRFNMLATVLNIETAFSPLYFVINIKIFNFLI